MVQDSFFAEEELKSDQDPGDGGKDASGHGFALLKVTDME